MVGHALRWAQNPFTIGSWANEAVGGVAKIELFGKELVLVTDPEPIEEVLVEKRSSIPKSEQYEVVFGEGLGSVSGEQWRTQRDAITDFSARNGSSPMLTRWFPWRLHSRMRGMTARKSRRSTR